ncbi:hypothetical protein DFH06DRAFT_1138115 [Mycena polygramma]|nr:hypothetical protein DFH06DRAFT_1138115 [Mycena polygramma]
MRVALTISAILIASVAAMAVTSSDLSKLSCPDGRFTVANCCRRVDSGGKGFGCANVAFVPKNNKEFKHMCGKLDKKATCCANSLGNTWEFSATGSRNGRNSFIFGLITMCPVRTNALAWARKPEDTRISPVTVCMGWCGFVSQAGDKINNVASKERLMASPRRMDKQRNADVRLWKERRDRQLKCH